MKSQVQFITTPTADTPGTSLLLAFEHKSYIIGHIHEGIQRACIQRGQRMNKISDMFITGRTEWSNTGGVIGMILTTADSRASSIVSANDLERDRHLAKRQRFETALAKAKPKAKVNIIKRFEEEEKIAKEKAMKNPPQEAPDRGLRLHGGSNLMYTLATARRFVFRKGMPIDVNEIGPEVSTSRVTPSWQDENVRVWAMPIEPSTSVPIPISAQGSPRKRSFDDFIERGVDDVAMKISTNGKEDDRIEIENTYQNKQKVLKSVIGDMFNSEWRLDALFETHISNVKMPAKIFVRDIEAKTYKVYDGPLPGGIAPLPDITVFVRRPWPGALVESLPTTVPSSASMSYIIKNHPQRGKFLPQKAKELGVPINMYRTLTAGETIQFDGRTVKPEDVLAEGKPGGGFAVFDIPSPSYIESMINRQEWQSAIIMEGVEAIVWILGARVASDHRFQKFVQEKTQFKHIISAKDHSCNYLALDSVSVSASKLHAIDSERYLPLQHDNELSAQLPEALSHCAIANRGLSIELEPAVRVNHETSVEHLPSTTTAEESVPSELLEMSKAVKAEILKEDVQKSLREQNLPSPEAEIIALGTGSAIPSKYRNVSGTLLRVPGCGSYLLDAGENTLGQLSRIYNDDELMDILRDLKLIWISHMHADHHLGTTSVIKAWYKAVYGNDYRGDQEPKPRLTDQMSDPARYIGGADGQKLCIVSGAPMIKWLEEYSAVEDFGYSKLLPISASNGLRKLETRLHWNDRLVGFSTVYPEVNAAMRAATGLTDLQAVPVPHCNGAKAVSLSFPTGFKLSYSGDCRPSRDFAEIGKGSTVLLHEATFDDHLQGDAVAKRHSTTSEAIGVGLAMGAPRILLTHFSQRYQKIPVMSGVEKIHLRLEGMEPDALNEGEEAVPEMETAMEEVEAAVPELAGRKRGRSAESRKQGEGDRDRVQLRPGQDVKVGVMFDYMRVKVKDIALLERFAPAVSKVFEEVDEKGGVEEP